MLKVEQTPDAPVEENVLAEAIVSISKAFQALQRGGLNRDAIVLLVHHKCRVAQRDINKVLNALADLERTYTRRKA